MTIIQVRNVGTYGFDVTPLTGAGLSSAEASSTRSQVQDARALADAIRQALANARDAGTAAFKPADSLLALPGTLSADTRDTLFDTVIARAFSGGPLDLLGWSQAVDALERWAGAQASMLPPDAGGGSRMVQGTWYVNGLPWSLSELFTVNRVNTLSAIDRMVADSLNVIAANNEAAKSLTGLMKQLFDIYYGMGADEVVSRSQVDAAGQVDAAHPISPDQLLSYADRYIGPGSTIRTMLESPGAPDYVVNGPSGSGYDLGEMVNYQGQTYEVYQVRYVGSDAFGVGFRTSPPTDTRYWREAPNLSKDDFRAMIDEVETIINAFGSDNQVAQLRNETLFNSRSNLLEGLSTFLRGQQTTRSELARNA